MKSFIQRNRSLLIIVGILLGYSVAMFGLDAWHQYQVEQRANAKAVKP